MDDKLKRRLERSAREGERITFTAEGAEKASRIWPGLGNRAGLHSFQFTLMADKWTKSGERFLRKLDKLGAGTFRILDYRSGGRGSWVCVATINNG